MYLAVGLVMSASNQSETMNSPVAARAPQRLETRRREVKAE
jgi:hypothetical protein